jgi:hypothetical protein
LPPMVVRSVRVRRGSTNFKECEILNLYVMDTTYVNRNFRIKIFGIHEGRKLNTLVGVSGLVDLVGEEIARRAVEKADMNMDDKFIWRLRRGIKITLYNK